jgi:HopA1 effector protein family
MIELQPTPELPFGSQKLSSELQAALHNIIDHVQFDADFRISHPNYEPLELEPEVLKRLQPLPSAMKRQYLSIQLRSFLHSIYWNGTRPAFSSSTTGHNKPRENDAVNPTNLPLYQKLHANNSGHGYFDAGWEVLGEAGNEVIAVQKDNLTLYIHQHHHLRSPHPVPSPGDNIEILLPSNRVEPDRYIAIGNEGLAYLSSIENPQVFIHLYFNLSSEGAIAMMQGLTQQLNNIPVPFMFKVGYDETNYDRYDTGVLTIAKKDYGRVQEILANLYVDNKPYFQPNIPLFTKQLAPGVGVAEEINHALKLSSQDNFGTHYFQILANGLLEASEQGEDSPDGRMHSIFKQFDSAGINLIKPYLHPESEDIFAPLQDL